MINEQYRNAIICFLLAQNSVLIFTKVSPNSLMYECLSSHSIPKVNEYLWVIYVKNFAGTREIVFVTSSGLTNNA